MLKKSGKRTVEITHKLTVKGSASYVLQFKVRAIPGSSNIRIEKAVRRSGGDTTFTEIDLKADGEWVTQKIGIRPKEGARKSDYIIAIIFLEGKGQIQIDDIKVTTKE